MRNSKKSNLSVESLETINLLSALSPHQALAHAPAAHRAPHQAPVHHAPHQTPSRHLSAHQAPAGHVHANADRAPHQIMRYDATGEIIKGSLTGSTVIEGDVQMTTASGKIVIYSQTASTTYSDVTVYINTHGSSATFSIHVGSGSDWIFGKSVSTLNDGYGGYHYMTTGGAGAFSSYNTDGVISGTGYYNVTNGSVYFNAHQSGI